ncbi:hypothetical protein KI387_026317, partial [Taxus chinensis]
REMVSSRKKLVGLRNPVFPAKKWQQKRKQEGMVKNVVEGFKSAAKTVQGAKKTMLKLLKEWLELEPDYLALAYKPTEQESEPQFIFPPMAGHDMKMQKKTIVLDLDETLIHSSEEPLSRYDFATETVIEGEPVTFYVLKRPGMDELLR